LLGTTSIEQSLNLQISNHLVNVDMIMNPSRMEQLAGRIRRDGSTHHSVYVHNLLTIGTQEERYLPALEREQALIDHIWDSKSELFDSLSPLELLRMIGGAGR
jgi:SNF2 family DNA or RNA helicase